MWSSTVSVQSTDCTGASRCARYAVAADEVGGLHLRPLHAGLDDGALGVELVAERAVALLDPAGGAVDADADRYGAVRRRPPRAASPRARPRRPSATYSSQPSSPTYEMREASTVVPPTAISRQVRKPKPSSDTSSSVSEDRMSRARGPHRPIVETSSVRSVMVVAVVGQLVAEPLQVGPAVGAAGDDAEVVVAQPHHGQVGEEAALGVEHRRVDHLADRDVALRDAGALHGVERAGAGDVEDLERRQVDDAGRLAHPQVLGVDDRAPPAGVPLVLAGQYGVAVLLEEAGVGLVPVRPLPARGLEEHRAELLLRRVHRGEPLVAVGLVLLGRVDDPVGLDERLGGAQPGVLAAHLVRVEARDVAVVDVDLAVPVGHPLGDRAADARALLDPDRRRRSRGP